MNGKYPWTPSKRWGTKDLFFYAKRELNWHGWREDEIAQASEKVNPDDPDQVKEFVNRHFIVEWEGER